MLATRPLAALPLLLVVACARSTPVPAGPGAEPWPPPLPMEGEEPGPRSLPPEAAAPPAAPVCDAFVRPGVLRRASVVRAVEAGLGRWLAGGVEVDPVRDRGRFRGWLIRRLYPGDPCYAQVDVRPGDIVLRLNGRSLERPEQANEFFAGLKSASSIVVEYVRDGKPQRLVLPIAE